MDSLLGWRNYATLQSTGTFPTPGLVPPSTSATDTAYYKLFVSNPRSLLQVPLTVWNNKTDQAFLSRQQLVAYFAATGLDPKNLQYLATFSRSLNQPSYVPEATRPQVLAPQFGGNDSYGNTGITPNFLTARVVNAFANPNLPANPNTRLDGTPVVIGEPLVKKRFPLNRLAWLTYKGPSSKRNTSDPDVAALISTYGITTDFLQQGTDDNIATYFGLVWDPTTKWTYIHGSGGTILNVSNPSKSPDVAHQIPGREPDFFELLKAAINPGSIAKTSLSPSIVDTPHPDPQGRVNSAQQQYNLDSSLDIAILQIGANIIDQFDTDGYPTRINYNLASSGAVYGVENLPYISRVRSGLLRLVEASPAESDPGDSTKVDTRPILNTGVGALMNFPEIWNPHDWSSNNLAQSLGVVGPSSFKIFATTNSYRGIQQTTSVYAWGRGNTSDRTYSQDADKINSPGFESAYGYSFGFPTGVPQGPGGEARVLSEANTIMTFTIDPTQGATSGALFREPTILYQPGLPSGSQLASTALVSSNGALGYLANASNAGFFGASGGLISGANGTFGNPPLPKQGSVYLGFYLGAHPLRWYDDGTNGIAPQSTPAYQTEYGPVNDTIYTLACQDPSGAWIPYDSKAMTTTGGPNGNLQTGPDADFGLNGTVGTGDTLDYGLRYFETVDPRSSRFGMMDPWISSNANSIPPRQGDSFVNQTDGTLKTAREGVNSGEAFNFLPFTGDPYLGTDWYPTAMGWYHSNNMTGDNSFRPGLLSQNNPNVTPDGIVSTGALPAGTNVAGTFPPFYYADPDGVVRRASAGNVPGGAGVPASEPGPPNKLLYGLPIASANASGQYGPNYSSGTTPRQIDSRPVILNRPFRSVAELGYVYSGTPWKNLDFFLPESGDAALLDVFCVSDNSDANALTAGQVNLNTHQVPVLQAILAQANKDQWNDASATAGTAATTIVGGTGTGAQAQQIAQLLVTRTVTGPATGPNASGGNGAQPLQNVSDLVGRWVKSVPVNVPSNGGTIGGIDGSASYDGFTTDLANFTANNSDPTMHNIQRFGESAVRALANAGQTRVWNLMFDIVAQTGRYTKQATTLDQFTVEGEQHYWVHVAIDRYTGQIVDKQVEIVKE